MRKKQLAIVSLALLAALGTTTAFAQGVNLPQASQKAALTQTVGLTDVTITYHRPKVNERDIWGALVPWDQVWRVGANQNTTIEFSTDVMVEDQKLAAGTYGLHMIPGQDEWTVIFSNNSTSWGSFSYQDSEDALRVKVKSEEAPHHELLTFDVIAQEPDSAVVVLNWDKVQVPFKVAIDTDEIVLANLRNELRTLPGFTWNGWNAAANYCLQNEINYEEALQWADQSLQREERFTNLQTKSQLLEKTGKGDEAQEIMAKAIKKGNAGELHNYARQLVTQGKPDKAMEIFKLNGEKHPDVWFIDVGMARGYSALGEYKKAAASLRAAIPKAPEPQRPFYENLAKQLDEGQAIN